MCVGYAIVYRRRLATLTCVKDCYCLRVQLYKILHRRSGWQRCIYPVVCIEAYIVILIKLVTDRLLMLRLPLPVYIKDINTDRLNYCLQMKVSLISYRKDLNPVQCKLHRIFYVKVTRNYAITRLPCTAFCTWTYDYWFPGVSLYLVRPHYNGKAFVLPYLVRILTVYR